MSRTIRTIVVGVAAPDASDPALLPALALARRLGASLHVVHVARAPLPEHPSPEREELGRALEDAVSAHAPGTSFTCRVAEGMPAEGLCDAARRVSADLLVLGATRARRVWRQFLGSTVEAVVRRSPLPVLVVKHAPPGEARRVLLTPDLSPEGEEAHERGVDLVKALFPGGDPELRALLAVQDTTFPPALSRAALERIAQREIDRFLRERHPRGMGVHGRVRVGCPADEILAEATEWRADLVVLGVYGRAGREVHPLGRVEAAVLRRAGANVLVVPVSGSAPGALPESAEPLSAASPSSTRGDPLHLPVMR